MPNFNQVTLIGHMTRDAQTKHLDSGQSVTEFALAVSEKYKDKETVCFIECTAWGKIGEIIAQYTSKGSPLMVSGKLTQDTWEQDGQKRSKIKVTVRDMQLLGGKREGESRPSQQPEPASSGGGFAADLDEPPF